MVLKLDCILESPGEYANPRVSDSASLVWGSLDVQMVNRGSSLEGSEVVSYPDGRAWGRPGFSHLKPVAEAGLEMRSPVLQQQCDA